jgi:DNA-binding response OmpR family regulator
VAGVRRDGHLLHHINQLRNKLGDEPSGRYIRTDAGVGYRFVEQADGF